MDTNRMQRNKVDSDDERQKKKTREKSINTFISSFFLNFPYEPFESPTCLVPLPQGYKTPIRWPRSRDQSNFLTIGGFSFFNSDSDCIIQIWYNNVPRTKLVEVKGHQNWVKVTGEYLSFPGGGNQFKNGALHYIDHIKKSLPDIRWGKRTRVILDFGCVVASFGGYLFERDVFTMSFAPNDEHEAQVKFSLERGIPAISAVMGTQRLPFPSKIFDAIHWVSCRVPWHIEGDSSMHSIFKVSVENFYWSSTVSYDLVGILFSLLLQFTQTIQKMLKYGKLVVIYSDKLNQVGAAIYRKLTSNECYDNRKKMIHLYVEPMMIQMQSELEACMNKVPVDESIRGTKWPKTWPQRFAAALKDLNVWVMNVVPLDSPDTLPIIYERGLFWIYHTGVNHSVLTHVHMISFQILKKESHI
uniref:Methyltransferase n=1 Tax=Lactuca sativa TaxID=4236 RepID=A0A9R1WJW5_LACSA|nr:hypothetical protein LSAT_V11C100038360 [Lactuca sativa]